MVSSSPLGQWEEPPTGTWRAQPRWGRRGVVHHVGECCRGDNMLYTPGAPPYRLWGNVLSRVNFTESPPEDVRT